MHCSLKAYCARPVLTVPTFAARCLHVLHDARDPSSERWYFVGEKLTGNFAQNVDFHVTFQGSFTRRKSKTWNRRLYFPSEGRRAEDFFALKNPTASVGFEPANLGTKGQHATPRPPKPLYLSLDLISINFAFCHIEPVIYVVGLSQFVLKGNYWLVFVMATDFVMYVVETEFCMSVSRFKGPLDCKGRVGPSPR